MMSSSELEICDLNGKILQPDEIKARIELLRNLVTENKTLDTLRNDDAYLLRYLHASKFDVDAAYEKVIKFSEASVELKDWLAVDPPEVLKVMLGLNLMVVLEETDKNGRRLFLNKFGSIDASKTSMAEYVRIIVLWLETILDDPVVQAKGVCMLVDLTGFSWKLLGWITTSNVKKIIKAIECVVFNNLMIHVVNTPPITKLALKIFMPLLPSKVKEQIKFHLKDISTLYDYVAPESLPKQYGGATELNFDVANSSLLAQ